MSHSDFANLTDFTDFEDSIRDLLGVEAPRKVVLTSVHRPTFSQQLSDLNSQRPEFTDTQPPVALAQALGRKRTLREIDIYH